MSKPIKFTESQLDLIQDLREQGKDFEIRVNEIENDLYASVDTPNEEDAILSKVKRLEKRIAELESRSIFIPQVPTWGDPPPRDYRFNEAWCDNQTAGSSLKDSKK